MIFARADNSQRAFYSWGNEIRTISFLNQKYFINPAKVDSKPSSSGKQPGTRSSMYNIIKMQITRRRTKPAEREGITVPDEIGYEENVKIKGSI